MSTPGTIMHPSCSDLRALLLESSEIENPSRMLKTFWVRRTRSDVLHAPTCSTAELLPEELPFCALEIVCEWRTIASCCSSWELAHHTFDLAASIPLPRLSTTSALMELRHLALILTRWLETAPVGEEEVGFLDPDADEELAYLVSASQAAGVLVEIVESAAALRVSAADPLLAPVVVSLLRRCRSLVLAELNRLAAAPSSAWSALREETNHAAFAFLRRVSDATNASSLTRARTLAVLPVAALADDLELALLALISSEVFSLPSLLLLEADSLLVEALIHEGKPLFLMPSGFSRTRPDWVSEVSLTLQILDRPGLEALTPTQGAERVAAALAAALAALSS